MHLNLHSHSAGGEGICCPDPRVPAAQSGTADQRSAAACEVSDSAVQVPQKGEPGLTAPAGDFSRAGLPVAAASPLTGQQWWGGETVQSAERFCFLGTLHPVPEMNLLRHINFAHKKKIRKAPKNV